MLEPEITLNYKLTRNDLTKAIRSYMVEEGAVIGDTNINIDIQWGDIETIPLEDVTWIKVSVSKKE